MATTISSSTSAAGTTATTAKTTTTAAQQTAAANRAAAQKLISSLNAGSGVDVAALAQNLVDAERVPQQNAINAKITKNESRISGYAAVSYVLSQVQTALTDLKDQNSFNTLAVDNSVSNAVGVTASAKASAGVHEVEVLSLAKAQRTTSNGFSALDQSLNGGKAITFSLALGVSPSVTTSDITLADGQDTPQALVDAINTANKGVKAQIVNTGDAVNPYKIVLTGEQGALKQFSLTPQYSMGGVGAATDSLNNGKQITLRVTTGGVTQNIQVAANADTPQGVIDAINNQPGLGLTAKLVANPAGSTYPNKIFIVGPNGAPSDFSIEADYDDDGLADNFKTLVAPASFALTNNQSASNAQIKVDGVTFTRTSNTISDAVTGLSFNLKSLTGSAGTVGLTRDSAPLKTKMDAFVTAYNDAMTIFTAVSDPKSTLDTYGATLVGDTTARSLRQQLRDMVTKPSSTPGTSVSALWQMGFKIDEKGVMSLDATKFDQAVSTNFDDVVKAWTGNQNGLANSSTTPAGIAGDAVRKLATIIGPSGVLLTQSNNADQQNQKYKEQLTKLQSRMDSLLQRYQKQFASMESLVGSVNSQKTSLKSSFDGMMAMYTNK